MPIAPLRPVEAIEIDYAGEPAVVLRDPEGLCPEPIVLPLPAFLILTLFDGRREARDIQGLLAQAAGGQIVPTEVIEKIAADLEDLCLLDTPRAAERRAALADEYAALPARPAVHAGSAYPAEAPELENIFADYFKEAEAPPAEAPRSRALVIPHIDFRVGGATIARGIARMPADRPPRLYVILGVAHQGTPHLFTATDKAFETPLGAVEVDTEALATLQAACSHDLLEGQIAHLHEHSIEFAAVMLRYHHRAAAREFKILPVLCGSLHAFMEPPSEAVSKLILPGDLKPRGATPLDHAEVREFIPGLKQLIEQYGDDICIIASVDLSHVGRKFGEDHGIDPLRAQTIRREDNEMLDLVCAHDAEAFFQHFCRDANARNVDAVCSVYVLLNALARPCRTDKIAYEQWHEEPTDSMVTFASLALY